MNESTNMQEVHQTAAFKVCAFAETLSARAVGLAIRAESELTPIIMPTALRSPPNSHNDSSNYPPLFSDLNEKLLTISNALYDIEDTLSRLEL